MKTILLGGFGKGLAAKVITGIVTLVVVTGGFVSSKVFLQYKKITFHVSQVQLVETDWSRAVFRITMDIDNPNKRIHLSNLNTEFFLEDIHIAAFDTTALILEPGQNLIIFERVEFDYNGVGKSSLEAMKNAWQRQDNTVHFGFKAAFRIHNPLGLPGTWLAYRLNINTSIDKEIPVQVPALSELKLMVDYAVLFYDKSATFRKQVYSVVVQTLQKLENSPRIQALMESGKANMESLAVVGGAKVAEFLQSRNVRCLLETFKISDDQFTEIYEKSQALFDRAIRMGIATWAGLQS